MPKFLCSTYETIFYRATAIEAKTKEEAFEKYAELIEEGEIPITDNEWGIGEVEEIIKQ